MIQKIKKATISVLLIGLMALSVLKPVMVYAEDEGYANENVIPGDESETNTEIKPLKVGDIKNIYTTATSKKKVLLRWSKAKNAKSYYVYKKVSGGQYRKVATTTKLSRSIEVTPGKKYGFKVIPFYQYKKTIIPDKNIGTEDGSETPSDNTNTDPSVIV